MITRFLCEFVVFYHLKIVVSVSKSNPKIPSTINSHTCYFAIPINHNKQTSNTVADEERKYRQLFVIVIVIVIVRVEVCFNF